MNIIRNQRGTTYVMAVLSITVILGFAALVIDIGLLFIEKMKISNAVDAAVLAGAQELPSDPQSAIQVAKDYASLNGISSDNIEVTLEENNTVITVSADKQVNLIFARVLGITSSRVNTVSKAKVTPVIAVYEGIRPFVVEQQEFQYGQQVILKEDGGDGYNGNYGAVALGGTGSSVFLNNVKYGYRGKLKIGDLVYTEPGNMAQNTVNGIEFITDSDSTTFESFQRDSLRLWTIPIADSLSIDGRDYFEVVGFAEFFVEGVVNKAGQAEIIGRFIRFASNGDISDEQTDFGLMGVKLIQ